MALSAAERLSLASLTLDNLLTLKQTLTADWVSAGMPPTMSVEGESFDWPSLLAALDASIKAAQLARTQAAGPWWVRSRMRG